MHARFWSASAGIFALALTFACLGASNVLEYTYDNAGNITQVARQTAAGFAITGFDPASGLPGASVTIYGTGFSTTPANNTVKFNGATATVSASDAGSIATSVPAGATTGKITVTVAGNTATSAQDFVVLVPGAPTIASFTPAYGASGDSITVSGTNFAVGATTVKLNGVTATASVSSTSALSFTVPASTGSGRITATTLGGTGASAQDFIVPPAGTSGADIIATLRLDVGGSAGSFVIGTASKNGMVLFDGAANTYYTVQFSQISLSPTSATPSYKVIKPDNSVLATGYIGSTYRPTIHLPKLSAAGTYSILVSPGAATLNTNVKVAADPTLSIDGAAVALSQDSASQGSRVVFDATAGQRIGVGATGTTFTPTTGAGAGFAFYLPDGSTLSAPNSPYCYAATGGNPQANCDGEITTTVAGTYTMVVTPPIGYALATTVQMSNEVAGTLAFDSQSDVTLARVGQDARYTYAASTGDSLGIDLSGMSPQPQAQPFRALVSKPDGSLWIQCYATSPAGAYCELGAAPTSGNYSVWVDPDYGAYGTFKLTAKQGPVLQTTDSAAAFSANATGETMRFRFTGTAGQSLAVGIDSLAYTGSSGNPTNLKVFRPDTTQVGSAVSCLPTTVSGRCKITLTNLPVSGTYSVVIALPGGVKIAGNVTLSSDITGTLVAGTAQSVSATRVGQNARYTFSGTAGDSTSIKLMGVATTPSNQQVTAYVYKPDGNYYASTYSTGNPAILNLPSLPATGTYTVLLEPYYGTTWQAQVMLDPGTAMTIDGPTAALATSITGEPLRYRFSGTTGQRVDFGLSGLTYGSASANATGMAVYKSDGTLIVSNSCYTASGGTCEASYASLPSTGTYSVAFTPPAASSITAGTFAISTPLAGSFVVGDPAQTVAITRPGQTARYTFSGTSGQLLRLNWSSTTVSGGSSVSVQVLNPSGSTVSTGAFANAATGGIDIASLPTTGTYTVVFDPASAATISASVGLATR